MRIAVRRWRTARAAALPLIITAATSVFALQVREDAGRFSALIIQDGGALVDVATTELSELPSSHASRQGWERFRAGHGPDWTVHLDRRSGAPLLVEGNGIPWMIKAEGVEGVAASLRPFIAENKSLLLADDVELVLDPDASGELNPGVWQVSFARRIAGIPVAGERYLFTVAQGKLVSFGTPRWSRIDADPNPDLDAAQAQARLMSYMGLTPADVATLADAPSLQFIPLRAAPAGDASASRRPYAGPVGGGYTSALVWRIALRVDGDPGTWVGQVDAATGDVRSFVDDTRYVRVKGGIYPIGNDQNCPSGCEQPGYPMPFAKVMIDVNTTTTTTMGSFVCTPGGAQATTVLDGQYVKVVDSCGPVSQSVTCSSDIDLSASGGTDCIVPPGSSAGNTHAARSSFYHLNRIAEHARVWLPSRTWLSNKLIDNVNLNSTCNAFWDGAAVNFFKSGGGCNNTGEIAAVFLHEWGHGLDQNDGGGFDSPSEAYADITSLMSTHNSCLGPGFRQSGTCGGYGNHCLTCTGVRDLDWDKRQDHVPSTPAGFAASHCAGGGAPCGREEHCEGYIAAETLWDLATRDLPASGLDAATSWNVADKLWYKSRLGSGGDAYNCSLPNSDGCSAAAWFSKLRTIDDDDANLANGTPHAAAIFAAFNRHAIACGTAADPSNQSTSSCPGLGAPTLSGTAGTNSAALSWTPVPGSTGFRVLRNDSGCQAAVTQTALTSGSAFNDNTVLNGFTVYYRMQALASNGACDGPLSNCVEITPQSGAGTIKMDAQAYGCSDIVTITVVDSNVGAVSTLTANLTSTTETVPEPVTLTRAAPGSASFVGTIGITSDAPTANGLLSAADGNTITARYVDANDGAGHNNQQRVTTAAAVCPAPPAGAKPVADGSFGTPVLGTRLDVFGSTIGVTWDVATCVSTDHHLIYGNLSAVASLTVIGGVCDLGTTGTATWTGVPSQDLWFLIVGDDDASTESSWGTDGNGAERGGTTPSGVCNAASRDNQATCP